MPATTGVSSTGNAYVDGVLGDTRWAVSSLTFSFPAQASFYGGSYGTGETGSNFGQLNSAQQAAARAAFAQIAAVTDLVFTEITETSGVHADLRLASSDRPSTAWAYLPHVADEGGDAWFNRSSGSYASPQKGNYAFATFVHEIGHALGLEHPHQGTVMPVDRDSMEYSIMSYRSYIGISTSTGYVNETWGFAQSLMMYDIAALQHMYGADYSTNSGSTTYSWSPTTGEMFINGVGQGAPGANRVFLTVWDGGGTDTYDFSNYSTALAIDLRPGYWTVTSSAQLARLHYNGSQLADGNIANALLHGGDTRSLIENAIGGSGNDRILGNQGANTLAGGKLVISWGADGAANALSDFDGDDSYDVIQIERSGSVGVWLSSGATLDAREQWGSGSSPGDKTGDFNADGRDDLIQLHSNGRAYVWTSTGSAFNHWSVWGSGISPTDRIGDFNGDGRDDLVQPHLNGRAYVWISNGSGFDQWSVWGTGVSPNDQVGDFNGDGRDDLIQLHSNGRAYVWTSNGSGFDQWSVWGSGITPYDKVGDFNGDGRADLVQPHLNGRAYVWISNGSSFDQWSVWGTGVSPGDRVGDFDGDGRDDLIQLHINGRAYVWTSTGSGFNQWSVWGTGVQPADRIADVNGDGRDDIVRLDASGTAFVWLSTGTGFGAKTSWGTGLKTGTTGNDTFVFQAGFGHDTITDFEAGSGAGDVIEFASGLFADFNAVLANAVDTGAGVVITYDGNSTLTLSDLLKADLYVDDFAFA